MEDGSRKFSFVLVLGSPFSIHRCQLRSFDIQLPTPFKTFITFYCF